MIGLGIFVAVLFLYSLVSQRLDRTVFTAPIVFTSAGMLMSFAWERVMQAGMNPQVFLRLAEIGLVLLLFTDASHTDLNVLRSITYLPARLLSVGLLLTIALGALTARWVFPHFSLWEACIVGAILAPTDAGLGQVIISSPRRQVTASPLHQREKALLAESHRQTKRCQPPPVPGCTRGGNRKSRRAGEG